MSTSANRVCTSLDSLFIDETQHRLEYNDQYIHSRVLSIQPNSPAGESVQVFPRSRVIENMHVCVCRQMHQACQHRNNSTCRHKMQVTFIFWRRSSKVSRCKDIPNHYSNRSTAEIKLTRQIQSCARVQSGILGFCAWRYIPLNARLASPVEILISDKSRSFVQLQTQRSHCRHSCRLISHH